MNKKIKLRAWAKKKTNQIYDKCFREKEEKFGSHFDEYKGPDNYQNYDEWYAAQKQYFQEILPSNYQEYDTFELLMVADDIFSIQANGKISSRHGYEILEVMEWTGIYDNTQWDELTQEEKQAFFNLHNSNDGKNIIYENIDDVKSLWQGKEIYEGDILEAIATSEFNLETRVSDVIRDVTSGYAFALRAGKGYNHGLNLHWGGRSKLKIIGNIYKNPDLLPNT